MGWPTWNPVPGTPQPRPESLVTGQEIQTQTWGSLGKGRNVLTLSPRPQTHTGPYVEGNLLFPQVLRKAAAAILTHATPPNSKFECVNTYKEGNHHHQTYHKHSPGTQTDQLTKGITEQFKSVKIKCHTLNNAQVSKWVTRPELILWKNHKNFMKNYTLRENFS